MAFSSAASSTSQIEMTLSCRNLRNRDLTSRSDPYCVVSMKDWHGNFVEIGRTEVINDCLSPEWVTKIVLDYNFQTIQPIQFKIFDKDPDDDDFLGIFETTLAEIVSWSSRQYVKPLRSLVYDGLDFGQLIVVTEELSTCKLMTHMKFAARNLVSSRRLSKPEAFVVISRCNEDGSFSVVYKSKPEVVSPTTDWRTFNMRVRTLCNGDFERTIKFDVYKWKADGQHRLIGSCFSSLHELLQEKNKAYPNVSNEITYLELHPNKIFIMEKPENAKDRDIESHLVLREISLSGEVTFLDYIKTGTQMHFAVAIDFTSSNGTPNDPKSLHYLDPNGTTPNSYEIALRAIGNILAQYDSLKMYPAFGFGAKVPPSREVSHQFHLNGHPVHPYCVDVQSILEYYRKCLTTVTFAEPTNFAPVISNTANIAARYADGKHYFVLLILSDGSISDMEQTKQAIIAASAHPLSIVILGIGNGNFEAMTELDADRQVLSTKGGATAERDIVQFVQLNKFMSRNSLRIASQDALAAEVLAEIPEQMIGYMKKGGFKPIGQQLDEEFQELSLI